MSRKVLRTWGREGWMLAQCNGETAEAAAAYTCKQVIHADISQTIIYPDYHVLDIKCHIVILIDYFHSSELSEPSNLWVYVSYVISR